MYRFRFFPGTASRSDLSTQSGGSGEYGTLFRVKVDGTGYAVLKAFTDMERVSNLLAGPGGLVYGNLRSGGTNNLIRINANGSGFALLKTFSGTDGSGPTGLVQGSDGTLYGVTREGGSAGFGTIFRLNPEGSGFATLRNLSQADGTYPYGKLTIQRVLSPAPVMASFTPKRGPAGTQVTITGTNLNVATAVHFNNVPAVFTNVSATAITATVPAGNATGFITVTTPGGQATSIHRFTLSTAAWLGAGTHSRNESLSVRYYPNPFRQSFTLRVPGKGTAKVPFRIYNAAGLVVLRSDDLQDTQQVRLGTR